MNFSKEQKSLFKKNMKLFKKKIPSISEYIEKKIPANVEIYDVDGVLDVIINGSRFYGTDARLFAHQQIENYLVSPSMVEGFPPEADEARTPTHLELQKRLNAMFRRRNLFAVADRQRIDSSTVFLFGIGLGFHIYPFIAHTRCRDIVISETEPLFLVLSMYFTDWTEIFKTLQDRVAIVISTDPNGAFGILRSHVHYKNPGVLQTIFHMRHYKSEIMDAVYEKFQEKAYLIFDGLGFYDDEKTMTRNTVLNLYMDRWKFCGDVQKPLKGTAVVVGAGPSLNKDIDWLIQNKEDIIIFSGGSALQSLLSNGIIPDFHVEIENIALNYELLEPLTRGYDLSKTVLICSSTMDVRSARLFNRRLWFIREGVMASSLFCNDLPMLSWQNPTVVNTAASACMHLGFRHVIFVGADFGTVDPNIHHSKGTSYETHDELKIVDFKFPEVVSGNFGGKVHTNVHLKNGINTLSLLMAQFRSVRAFNASEGARVEKVTPTRLSRIGSIDKISGKEFLIENLYSISRDIDWIERVGVDLFEKLKEDFGIYIKILKKEFSAGSKKNKDIILFLRSLHEALDRVPAPYSKFNPGISGSITTKTIVLMYWWRRIPEDRLPEFEGIVRRFWTVFLRVIEKDFIRFVDQVRQELPLVRPELFDDKGSLIVEAKPSVQNAER
ncbi:hypothetical protein GCM10011497_00510 [Elstera cyanobacteriorum]|uniref:DUF115 domain-containing protein n=1 Tax=Elstera cyanobacteriorum TaxID=2022747 RepID=A0A255XPL1_9PROT|nr:6-hydroxymethylpterin diphosphokinase MptE-like protein [Elstera cyanobacteriorum]OYQ18926.1 hypothetical protein CHR90_11810 [Elstera cyanobacteriorum]GFZ76833.1 hypothetical protein GCM10011497_00510 [Elstera cyanobacteriorum]